MLSHGIYLALALEPEQNSSYSQLLIREQQLLAITMFMITWSDLMNINIKHKMYCAFNIHMHNLNLVDLYVTQLLLGYDSSHEQILRTNHSQSITKQICHLWCCTAAVSTNWHLVVYKDR